MYFYELGRHMALIRTEIECQKECEFAVVRYPKQEKAEQYLKLDDDFDCYIKDLGKDRVVEIMQRVMDNVKEFVFNPGSVDTYYENFKDGYAKGDELSLMFDGIEKQADFIRSFLSGKNKPTTINEWRKATKNKKTNDELLKKIDVELGIALRARSFYKCKATCEQIVIKQGGKIGDDLPIELKESVDDFDGDEGFVRKLLKSAANNMTIKTKNGKVEVEYNENFTPAEKWGKAVADMLGEKTIDMMKEVLGGFPHRTKEI